VTVIHRFGGGLNLNVHFHTLVIEDPAAIRAILDSLAASAERVDRAPPPVSLEPTTLATEV
jgi:hypothetical protein